MATNQICFNYLFFNQTLFEENLEEEEFRILQKKDCLAVFWFCFFNFIQKTEKTKTTFRVSGLMERNKKKKKVNDNSLDADI